MNSKIFEDFFNTFETEKLKMYCIDMVELMPAYNEKIASSSSGKYHSKQQCEEGGQVIHMKLACEIMNYILGLEYSRKAIKKPEDRDLLRTAIILHDAYKRGVYNSGKTVHEHPILTANWIGITTPKHDIDIKTKREIKKLVGSHSGEWRTSKYSDTVLPKCKTKKQFLVHLCDYLASRKNILLDVDG